MQIDTDLSPVVSPNSNISNSFTSQRDVLLFGLNSNRTNRLPSDHQVFDLQNLRGESTTNKTGVEVNFPVAGNQNNTVTTTNESYSVEKYTYLESLNKDPLHMSYSNGLIIPENSTDRELNHEEETSKSQIQTMHILEYEEFVTDKEHKLSARWRASEGQSSGRDSDRIERDQLEEKKRSKQQYFSENPQRKTETKVEFHSNGRGDIGRMGAQNNELALKANGMKKKKKLELQIGDSEEPNNASGNKNKQEEEVKKEAIDAHAKANQFFLKGVDRIQESNEYKEISRKGKEKEGENEVLVKENSALKEEIKGMEKDLKDLDTENLKLREEVNNQRDILKKAQEKFDHIGKVALAKENETIRQLEEENRLLREEKQKYREALKEKEEQAIYLRHQYEEVTRVNYKGLYEALADKLKAFEERTAQLSNQLIEQRNSVNAKDTLIENLHLKVDSLTNSVTSKNNEIILLGAEINSLKDEILILRDANDIKQEPRSVGSLYTRIREKAGNSPSRKEETPEARPGKYLSNSQAHSERKDPRSSSSTQRLELGAHRNFFQSSANRSEKSPEDHLSKTSHWNTLKWNILNHKVKMEQGEQANEQNIYKKAKNKSIDLNTKAKTESKKTSQNIEDLQKRLAYLKHKRMEFEKKKGESISTSKDSSVHTVRKSSIPEVSPAPVYKTTLRGQDLISPVRNMIAGNFHEYLVDQNSEYKKKEQLLKTSPVCDASSRSSLVHKTIQLHEPNINEELKTLRTALTTKPKFQPKMDNFVANNPAHHQSDEDFRLGLRYSSLSNVSADNTTKSSKTPANKNSKRHSDLSSYSRACEIRSITEAASNKHKDRDMYN